jgi:hypothetical protein
MSPVCCARTQRILEAYSSHAIFGNENYKKVLNCIKATEESLKQQMATSTIKA